jgi:GTP:adenosylcobinamide-phosphate guanylyltransferase
MAHQSSPQYRPFSALVLAGSRPGGDPLASRVGATSKASIRIAGTPMLARVLDAIAASPSVDRIVVVGLAPDALDDPMLARKIGESGAEVVEGRDSAAASALAALEAIGSDRPFLLTTSDHPLLRPEIVEDFLKGAVGTGADAVVGLVPFERVRQVSPDTRRTVTRLRDGEFCGSNLFALLTPTGRRAVAFWRDVEKHRKHPVRIARILGPGTLLRFLLGRLTLDGAMRQLSARSGATVRSVLLSHGQAAIDVDKPEDLTLAERLLGG